MSAFIENPINMNTNYEINCIIWHGGTSTIEGGESSKIYSGGVCITIAMSIMITLTRL